MYAEKTFNGRVIYQPKGKALEYSEWACNFFTGCSNDCAYCYCKKGFLKGLWSKKPRLKKNLLNEDAALDIFKRELVTHQSALRKCSLFFSFTTDPMLPETFPLTLAAMQQAVAMSIPVRVLSKRTDFLERNWNLFCGAFDGWEDLVAIGFTLTGCDELEPGASSNDGRIKCMERLAGKGFKTFASIEPIVYFDTSMKMIEKAFEAGCRLFLCGTQSGKAYSKEEIRQGMAFLDGLKCFDKEARFYLKDSLVKLLNIDRESLVKLNGRFVGKNFDMFVEDRDVEAAVV